METSDLDGVTLQTKGSPFCQGCWLPVSMAMNQHTGVAAIEGNRSSRSTKVRLNDGRVSGTKCEETCGHGTSCPRVCTIWATLQPHMSQELCGVKKQQSQEAKVSNNQKSRNTIKKSIDSWNDDSYSQGIFWPEESQLIQTGTLQMPCAVNESSDHGKSWL